MRKTVAAALLGLLLIALLAGCDALENDYLSIVPHLAEREDETGDADGRTASTYAELRREILAIISAGGTQETLILQNYAGDVAEDVPAACMYAQNNDPLGSYAVEYMTYETTRILTYYEVRVSVTYRRSEEQIGGIRDIRVLSDFRDALLAAVTAGDAEFVARVPYYYEKEYDVASLLQSLCYDYPATVLSVPAASVRLYPESGVERIVETTFTYSAPPSLERDKRALLGRAVSAAAADTADFPVLERLLALNDYVTGRVEYLPDREDDLGGAVKKDDAFNAYGALIEGEAVSEGYALAVKVLCDAADIECAVVSGRYGGVSHAWNIVRLGEHYYHLDTALGDDGETTAYLLRTDAQMEETHKWSPAAYPACAGPEISWDEAPVSAEGEETEA